MDLTDIRCVATMCIFALGLVGNTLSAAVWSTQVQTVGGARYLMALCVSDSLAIISGMAFNVFYLMDNICVAELFLFASDVFYFSSSYITVAIVIQRYLSIARPFTIRTVCSGPRQIVTIASLSVLTFVQNIVYGKYTGKRYKYCMGEDIDIKVLLDSYLKLVYAYVALNFVAPCLLTVFNLLLLRTLRHMKRLPSVEANRQHDRAQMTVSVMALWVSVTTVITYVMLSAVNFYVIYNWDVLYIDEVKENAADILILARDLSVAVTVSINFIFYSCFCQTFRNVVKNWCRNLTTRGNDDHGTALSYNGERHKETSV